MKSRRSLFLLASHLFILGVMTMGCGYHFRADGEPVGIKIESLAIPLMTSTSSSLGFEATFTKLIREEFISRTKVPIVPRERAELVIIGRIYDIRTEPLTFQTEQQTTNGQTTTLSVTNSRRLIVKIDVKLTESATGEVIWQNSAMEERDSFAVETDPLVTQFNEQQALERIARKMAQRIFLKTVERF